MHESACHESEGDHDIDEQEQDPSIHIHDSEVVGKDHDIVDQEQDPPINIQESKGDIDIGDVEVKVIFIWSS